MFYLNINIFLDASERSRAPEFRAVQLKIPSLAAIPQDDGEIFDDLDDDDSVAPSAQVASKEMTDRIRKSQIMDLNRTNE